MMKDKEIVRKWIEAIDTWLEYGQDTCGPHNHVQGHMGYYSDDGWAAVQLRELQDALTEIVESKDRKES